MRHRPQERGGDHAVDDEQCGYHVTRREVTGRWNTRDAEYVSFAKAGVSSETAPPTIRRGDRSSDRRGVVALIR